MRGTGGIWLVRRYAKRCPEGPTPSADEPAIDDAGAAYRLKRRRTARILPELEQKFESWTGHDCRDQFKSVLVALPCKSKDMSRELTSNYRLEIRPSANTALSSALLAGSLSPIIWYASTWALTRSSIDVTCPVLSEISASLSSLLSHE
jgi:hypothetical protein